ncbi:hypothetical protein J1N35_018891 [Gossypium stocksii]|uniref:Aminotransferase-like plant mobile domain-containing protein n=1 Tax=Gossypium stocksii TaxID=47602 RepID=A0A9D3VPV8_9ROSI|nr:hypothetical protein J1N35_018891 [Gossypium stocksii]
MMKQMMKMLKQISEVFPLLEEVMHDVSNPNHVDHGIIIDHPEFNDNSQQEFRIEDKKELNMIEEVSDPIDLFLNVTVDVEVKLTIGIELQLFLSESRDEPIHFLARVKETLTEEVDEFISFSFDDEVKSQETHTFHLPCGECIITLEDIVLQLSLPIDKSIITGSAVILGKVDLCRALLGKVPDKFEGGQTSINWLENNFDELLKVRMKEIIEQYA